MNQAPHFHVRKQQGMSLIEVLVAILVVALGILVMVVMQVNSTKFAKTSEIRAQAALLVADMADRMRANPKGFNSGAYALNATAQYPANGQVSAPAANTACISKADICTPANMAAADLLHWQRSVHFALPGGFARISARDESDNAVDIWLAWLDPSGDTSDVAENECPADFVAKPAKDQAAVSPRCMYFRINL